MSNKINIGKLGKSHGVHGAFKLKLRDSFIGFLEEGKLVHARLEGLDIPLIISAIKGNKENIITFKGLNTADKGTPFIGKDLYFEAEDNIGSSSLDQIDSFNGFKIIDQNDQKVGEIIRTEEFPQQLMAIVIKGEEQILIPMIEDFIIEIELGSKTIWMNLPEGILDL